MSQYTISIKSIINIKSHSEPYNDDVFNNTPKKIERGREIFFNYDYYGKNNSDFSKLFETAFIVNYFTRDIYTTDIELFMIALQNDVQVKSKFYFEKWLIINEKLKNIFDNVGIIESESKSNTKNSNKSLASQFPFEIKNASEFGNVSHMDSGAMSDGSGEAVATQKSIEYNSKITHAKELLEIESQNIINEFVNS